MRKYNSFLTALCIPRYGLCYEKSLFHSTCHTPRLSDIILLFLAQTKQASKMEVYIFGKLGVGWAARRYLLSTVLEAIPKGIRIFP